VEREFEGGAAARLVGVDEGEGTLVVLAVVVEPQAKPHRRVYPVGAQEVAAVDVHAVVVRRDGFASEHDELGVLGAERVDDEALERR
jgi:hypothetical protein